MLINPEDFYYILKNNQIDFFTGVPDSLLKDFCFFVDDKLSKDKHIIAANEGNAIAIAAGYHLSTNRVPLVYMQNSGLGNSVNPLLSLCDTEVYSIPMLLMIGWRGEPGVKDEPQHLKQGEIQLDLLKAMKIPYEIISGETVEYEKMLAKLISNSKKNNRPVALVVKKGTFIKHQKTKKSDTEHLMYREQALELILNNLGQSDIVISTTGKTSREIFEIRKKDKKPHNQDFLTVGSMGHCSSIALGIALSKKDKKIVCIDGDGSMLMHMGGLATIASYKPKNYKYIILNNKVHESVGGQSTAAKEIELSNIIRALGFKNVYKVSNQIDLGKSIKNIMNKNDLSFVEVLIRPGSRSDLGRPTIKPVDNKKAFMNFVKNNFDS
jgi:phosphonopyruvate decarboxylase